MPERSLIGKRAMLGGAVLLLLGNAGCVTGMRTKALRQDAYYHYETGDQAGALSLIQRGVASAAWPGVPGYVMIETYDDAGLYYYINDQPRSSFVHQAVAVLLAEAIETPPAMRKVYRERLQRALAACTDVRLEAADIDRDVRVLLTIPEIRANALVQRFY